MRSRIAILVCAAAALLATAAQAQERPAQPLSLRIAKVSRQALLCVFNPAPECPSFPSGSSVGVSIFSMRGTTGNAQLQMRTIPGAPGAIGAGQLAYFFQVHLKEVAALGEFACITAMTLSFAPVTPLRYDRSGQLNDVFVITEGDLGSIGLLSAVQTGSNITFTFDQPVCATRFPDSGESSFFFGLASPERPRPSKTTLTQPGAEDLVAATDTPSRP